jgi:hypothetical protein
LIFVTLICAFACQIFSFDMTSTESNNLFGFSIGTNERF